MAADDAATEDGVNKLAICALTYKRPDGVARLLEGFSKLTFRGEPPNASIVIVDNDANASARVTCEWFADKLPWPLKYVVEPRQGIAFARNTALRSVPDDADWIGFIDDDEVPSEGWLDELLRVRAEYDADVVAGPVLQYFPEPPAEWIVRARFFDGPRRPTGMRLPHVFTNNVIFRRSILRDLDLTFNERWALMGCEDRAFFQQIGMAGYRIVWADEATVTEWIPPKRANPVWLVQRHFRAGNCTAFVELDLRPSWTMRPLLLAKAGAWMGIGTLQWTAGLIGGRTVRLRGRRSFAYGVGLITGVMGRPFEEYRV